MAYINQLPSRQTVENLGSKYDYETIVSTIEEANAVNAEYETANQAAWEKVYSMLSTHDHMNMTRADDAIYSGLSTLTENFIDAVGCKGATGHGSSEFFPMARVKKDIKKIRRQIAIMREYTKSI